MYHLRKQSFTIIMSERALRLERRNARKEQIERGAIREELLKLKKELCLLSYKYVRKWEVSGDIELKQREIRDFVREHNVTDAELRVIANDVTNWRERQRFVMRSELQGIIEHDTGYKPHLWEIMPDFYFDRNHSITYHRYLVINDDSVGPICHHSSLSRGNSEVPGDAAFSN